VTIFHDWIDAAYHSIQVGMSLTKVCTPTGTVRP
jgi:hypothetical protein